MQRLTPLFDEGRDFAPGGRSLPANTSRMAIGGVTGLISDELVAGRAEQLPEFAFRRPFCHAGPLYRPGCGSKGGREADSINAHVHVAAMIHIPDSSTLAGGPMAVSETRRQLILEAMVRVVGRKGYKATSVADVIAEADVSRTTFYKHFEDKHECFLAAYDMVVERVLDEVIASCDGEQPWLERVRIGLATIVELFALDPELARTAIVEVAAAGADARQLHWNAITSFTEFLEDGEELAGGRELPDNIALMAAGAVSGLIFDELLTGRAERLPQLLPDLLFAMLVPYIGPGAATEEMRRAAAG